MSRLSSEELWADAGGQALGLELAGYQHKLLLEIDAAACETLRLNRPAWNVHQFDLRKFAGAVRHGIFPEAAGVDLLAGGVPCPPFSHAGLQLGEDDERDLFPAALDAVEVCKP